MTVREGSVRAVWMLRIVRSARHRFMRGLAGGSAAGRGKLRNYLIRCYEFEVTE